MLAGDPPSAVTTTLPEVAPAGTVAVIAVSLQLVMAAGAPLNVTEPVPCEAPKLIPDIAMEVPGAAVLG